MPADPAPSSCRTRGDPDGAVVVFTHGTLDDHRSFDPLVPFFVEAGYRTVTRDLPGHGGSEDGEHFDLTKASRDLLGLLDEIGAPTAVLIGHSPGGYSSEEAAIEAPHRLDALVVIGATSLTPKPSLLPMIALRLSVTLLRLAPKRWARRRAQHLFRRSTRSSRTNGAARQRRHTGARPGILRRRHPAHRPAPTLVCHGEHAHSGIIASAAPEWARRHPLVRHRVVPGAGHLAHRDNPGATARVVLDFLRGFR
ncbi:alpha/beta fold hydrolase [Lentzea sp. CC55]|uniref:alpha/beta fold hydrolase n=1 Tax=Lentzea sp. CC55 TaxID=2884909 RepID=UPI0027DF0757|nr:alpha/beta fold hydrolase [Lentzea sp. CC55]MCG8922611.1 alpha/beta fold hydrolase [Lentzea sp. CC55]